MEKQHDSLQEKMVENSDGLNDSISALADSFKKHFERIFIRTYPCDRESNETLQEANLTTNLLRALLESNPDLFTWDEFPVPPETNINPNNKAKNRIDSVVVDDQAKAITMIEAKCLKRAKKRTEISCQSIANDIARMINVANNPYIFPDRIWANNGLVEKPVPIGNGYNDYSTFGIAVCGVWWPGQKQNCNGIERYFKEGIDASLSGIYDRCPELRNKIDDAKTEVREIKLPNILLQGKKWQYFVILSRFRVNKGSITYERLLLGSAKDEPLEFTGFREFGMYLMKVHGESCEFSDGSDYLYFMPNHLRAHLSHQYMSKSSFVFWIPKQDNDHGLYAVCGSKSFKRRRITMPEGWAVADQSYHSFYNGSWDLYIYPLGSISDFDTNEGRRSLADHFSSLLNGLESIIIE